MKKTARAALALILVLLTAASGAGCGARTESVPEGPKPAEYVGDPSEIRIANPAFFAGAPSEAAEAWTAAMSSGGVKWKVSAPAHPDAKSYTDGVIEAARAGGVTGLVYVRDLEELSLLLEAGVIEPLTDYLCNDAVFLSIPEDFRSCVTVSGDIWEIPADASYIFPWARCWNSGALEKAGLEAPRTAAELSKVLEACGKGGKNVLFAAGAQSLSDIFGAFGAGLGPDGLPVKYDPESGTVSDSMLSEGAAQALSLLRGMYFGGSLNGDFLTAGYEDMEKAAAEGRALSAYLPYGRAALEYGPALYGKKARQSLERFEKACSVYKEQISLDGRPAEITAEVGGYCLIKGSAEPAETVKYLTRTLWGSRESFLKCCYGISGYAVREDGCAFERGGREDGTALPIPGLCSPMYGLYDPRAYSAYYDGATETEKEIAAYKSQYYYGLLDFGFADGRLVFVPPLLMSVRSRAYFGGREAFAAAFEKLLASAVTDPGMTVERALENYRADMSATGGDKALEEANVSIGRQSTQKYSRTGGQ